jgi:hypothetical protein
MPLRINIEWRFYNPAWKFRRDNVWRKINCGKNLWSIEFSYEWSEVRALPLIVTKMWWKDRLIRWAWHQTSSWASMFNPYIVRHTYCGTCVVMNPWTMIPHMHDAEQRPPVLSLKPARPSNCGKGLKTLIFKLDRKLDHGWLNSPR